MNDKVVDILGRKADINEHDKSQAESVYGIVTDITILSDVSAVAFGVQSGNEERLFWMSTSRQDTDPDYSVPLRGESVRIWFNDNAQTINVYPLHDSKVRDLSRRRLLHS